MDGLTPRQRDIVECRCGFRELSIGETAQALGISSNTVKNHGTPILRKIGVRTFYGVCREVGREMGFHEATRVLPAMRAEGV